jgi:hypothetical protein
MDQKKRMIWKDNNLNIIILITKTLFGFLFDILDYFRKILKLWKNIYLFGILLF